MVGLSPLELDVRELPFVKKASEICLSLPPLFCVPFVQREKKKTSLFTI